MTSGYAMQILKLLVKAEPGLLVCDPSATGAATASLAEVMGSLLATVLVEKGEATYLAVLSQLVGKIDGAARATERHALSEIENGSAEVLAKN